MWASDPDSPELSTGVDTLLLKPQRSVLRPVLSPDRGPVASSQDPLEGNRGARDMGEWGGEEMSTTPFKKKKNEKEELGSERVKACSGHTAFAEMHSAPRPRLGSVLSNGARKGTPVASPVHTKRRPPASAGRPRAPLEGKGAGTAGAWGPLPGAQPSLPSMRLPRCTFGVPPAGLRKVPSPFRGSRSQTPRPDVSPEASPEVAFRFSFFFLPPARPCAHSSQASPWCSAGCPKLGREGLL